MASNSPGQVEYGKAKAFYDKEDYGNALKHLSKSEELARREGDLGTLAVTHICKGVCLFRFSEFDLALKAFKHALPLAIEAESEASRTVFLLYRYLINSCLEKRDRMQARHYAERRVLWAEKHAKKDEMSESLFSCAEILAEYCDQRMRALDMYERALPLFDEDDEKRYNCVFRMGCVCTGLEMYQRALDLHLTYVRYLRAARLENLIPASLVPASELFLRLHATYEALLCAEEAYAILQKLAIEIDNVFVTTWQECRLAFVDDDFADKRASDDSRYCSACKKVGGDEYVLCAACKVIWYCTEECRQKDWPEHERLCNDLFLKRMDGRPYCAFCRKGKGVEMLCSGCQNAFYCSAECQRADWTRHKTECKK